MGPVLEVGDCLRYTRLIALESRKLSHGPIEQWEFRLRYIESAVTQDGLSVRYQLKRSSVLT